MESQWSVFYPGNYSNPATDTDETLYMRIKRSCTRFSERTALEYGATKLSYAMLLDKIDEAASAFLRLGVAKGDVVMVAMGNNPLNVISVYALDKIGASAALAVPNLATEYFAGFANCTHAKYCLMSCNQFLNYSSVLKETEIKTVIIGKYSELASGFTRIAIRFYSLTSYDGPKPRNIPDGIKLLYWKELFSLPDNPSVQDNQIHDRDFLRNSLYLFPSKPADCKAAELNARSLNISANICEMVLKANEDLTGKPSRMLCLNETCFSFGFSFGIHSVLSCGQTVVMFTWYDPDKIFFAIRRSKPDVLIGYNSTVAYLNKLGGPSDVMKSVERIIVGGGLLTSSQKATLFEIAKTAGKKLSLCSVTGSDEILAYAYGPSDLQSDRLLGFPLPGVLMRIADSSTGLDVPEGGEGEIAVCSPVSTGIVPGENGKYLPNFKKLPDGRVWFFTGLLGKQDGNRMFYLSGSKSREARINSYPVYPDKVDEAIQMTEGVVESCTVIIEKPEGPVLITAVVPEEEYFYDNSMMEDLRDRISSECELTLHEAMRPSEVTFLVSLPRDSKGSIDYDAVKNKIEMIQNEDMPEIASSDSLSE